MTHPSPSSVIHSQHICFEVNGVLQIEWHSLPFQAVLKVVVMLVVSLFPDVEVVVVVLPMLMIVLVLVVAIVCRCVYAACTRATVVRWMHCCVRTLGNT